MFSAAHRIFNSLLGVWKSVIKHGLSCMIIAVITVAPAVKYSFVSKGMQTRRTGQHTAKLTLSPRLHVKPLITVITVIASYIVLQLSSVFYYLSFSYFNNPAA